MRVAVDAMGGDHAPAEIVKGALAAVGQHPDVHVVLFGREEAIRPLLTGDYPADRVSVRNATQTIEMGESPVDALRRKPDTSIQRCIEALHQREVDAVVS